jgi:2-C-methyl-D-erythritol 2,4-cyclodiphosphate synthase
MNIRVGFGFDVHVLDETRPMWLGGIKLEDAPKGALGHSDADVLLHAICDALLGAANMRDIGFHFPNTSSEFKNADSKILLKKTVELIATKGYRIINIDATVVLEQPKINPHIAAMQAVIALLLNIDTDAVSIKATTSEKLGYVGKEEGVNASAVALIIKD